MVTTRTAIGSFWIAVGMLAAVLCLPALAADCETVRLPDGSYKTDCSASMPPQPAAPASSNPPQGAVIPPAPTQVPCITPLGTCYIDLGSGPFPSFGAPCGCKAVDGSMVPGNTPRSGVPIVR